MPGLERLTVSRRPALARPRQADRFDLKVCEQRLDERAGAADLGAPEVVVSADINDGRRQGPRPDITRAFATVEAGVSHVVLTVARTCLRSGQRAVASGGCSCGLGRSRSCTLRYANCPSLSRGSEAGPLEPKAPVPPSAQDRRQRCTDRTLTRSSLKITVLASPRSNRSAASSRNRSRNSRRSAVSPPPCGYRIQRWYRGKQAAVSPLRHHECNLSRWPWDWVGG